MDNIDDISLSLKNMSFPHPEMEKRRLHLIDALDHRCTIPDDDGDLWILNKIIPGALGDKRKEEIDEWYKDTLQDAMKKNLLTRIDTEYPNKREWFESLTNGQQFVVLMFEYNHKKLE